MIMMLFGIMCGLMVGWLIGCLNIEFCTYLSTCSSVVHIGRLDTRGKEAGTMPPGEVQVPLIMTQQK